MSDLIGTGGPPMPSSPGDLKPAHISPSPPASGSNCSSSITSQKVSAQTSNGFHSPNAPVNTVINGSQIRSSTPSPPSAHTGSAVVATSSASSFTSKTSNSASLTSNTTTTTPVTAASDLSFTSASSKLRQISKLKRFLTTLYQFTCDISAEVGERVHSLIIGLVLSTVTVEEFHQRIQDTTRYPLRPYVIPFLKLHLPSLQNEISHIARLSKLTPAQYIRQNESLILDVLPTNSSSATTGEPFEIFQPHDSASVVKEASKRRPSPELRKENGFTDGSERERGDGPPPAKRHQPIPSPTISSRLSPGNITPALLHTSGHNQSGNPSILHSQLSSSRNSMLEEVQRENMTGTGLYHIPGTLRDSSNGRIHSSAEHFSERFSGLADRYEKEFFGRPNSGMYSDLHRSYNEDVARDMEEEWKSIYTMLNCILGMVEKTKRALAVLQQRSMEYASSSPLWPPTLYFRGRHFPSSLDSTQSSEYHDLKKRDILSAIQFPKPSTSGDIERMTGVADGVRRPRPQAANQIEDAVNEVKRQAVVELQKAVSAAESKASELVAAERAKMERILSEARRHAAEDALAAISHQEDSNENCWNCGRKASETCSGCNVARYCGSFCQHKDWENHHRVCGQNREANSTNTSTNSSAVPTTVTDLKRLKGRSPTPPRNVPQPPTTTTQRTVITNGEREKSAE